MSDEIFLCIGFCISCSVEAVRLPLTRRNYFYLRENTFSYTSECTVKLRRTLSSGDPLFKSTNKAGIENGCYTTSREKVKGTKKLKWNDLTTGSVFTLDRSVTLVCPTDTLRSGLREISFSIHWNNAFRVFTRSQLSLQLFFARSGCQYIVAHGAYQLT